MAHCSADEDDCAGGEVKQEHLGLVECEEQQAGVSQEPGEDDGKEEKGEVG